MKKWKLPRRLPPVPFQQTFEEEFLALYAKHVKRDGLIVRKIFHRPLKALYKKMTDYPELEWYKAKELRAQGIK